MHGLLLCNIQSLFLYWMSEIHLVGGSEALHVRDGKNPVSLENIRVSSRSNLTDLVT
jgi:hypothetical protein